jgi:hypothetical protein
MRAAQKIPTPTSTQQWNYEGPAYLATPPLMAPRIGVPFCRESTVAIFGALSSRRRTSRR